MPSKHSEETSEPNVPISQAHVLVCGVARNCAHSAPGSIAALHQAARQVGTVRYHIVESDSDDNTAGILTELSTLYPLTFQSEGNLRSTMPSRTDRIAHCRNQLVDLVKTKEFDDIDFVVMADLDGLNETVSAKGLASCWGVKAPWGALTANQPEKYYDIWALRHDDWVPDDCWARFRRLKPEFGKKIAREMAIDSRQISIPSRAQVIEVDSAFGGLALYRKAAFIAGKYRGSNPDGSEVCEHVPFHAGLREAGFRVFINPALVNSAPMEHISGAPSLLQQLFQKLGRLFSNA